MSTVTPEEEVSYSRMAAALMGSPAVQALPVEQRWALRDVLAEHDSIDSLPVHVKRLFSDAIHPHVVEAAYTERLHPRGRAGRWIDKPGSLVGDLIRGSKIRGGKGRRSPAKGKARGWLDRVNEIRAEPILPHRELKRKLDNALIDADRRLKPWVPIGGGQGERLPRGGDYQRDNVVLHHEVRPYGYNKEPTPGYEVLVDGESRGWTPYDSKNPADTLDNLAFRVAPDTMPERERARRDFVGKWWGGAGRPGHFQTMSGDPGVAFQEQHARIMEAGAHIDAEINRRLNAPGRHGKRVKQLEADLRLYTRSLKEAEAEAERSAYDAIAKRLIRLRGYDPERVDAEWAKKMHASYLKKVARADKAGRVPLVTHDEHQVADMWSARFDVGADEGIDVRGADDQVARARMHLIRGRDDVRAARAVLDEDRRKLAYDVLTEIRPFASGSDLDLIEDLDRISEIPWEHGAFSSYDAKYVAAPKLRRAETFLPLDWISDSNRHQTRLVPGWAARGKYAKEIAAAAAPGRYSGIIGSPSPESPGIESGVGTMVHELVHRSEHVRDGIKGAEWTFYASRVAPRLNARWEDLKALRDLTGNDNYRPDEQTREDEFVDIYAGKSYGDEPNSSYEILSMGIEDLVTGEHKIISQDEEYRHFVFGALALL